MDCRAGQREGGHVNQRVPARSDHSAPVPVPIPCTPGTVASPDASTHLQYARSIRGPLLRGRRSSEVASHTNDVLTGSPPRQGRAREAGIGMERGQQGSEEGKKGEGKGAGVQRSRVQQGTKEVQGKGEGGRGQGRGAGKGCIRGLGELQGEAARGGSKGRQQGKGEEVQQVPRGAGVQGRQHGEAALTHLWPWRQCV